VRKVDGSAMREAMIERVAPGLEFVCELRVAVSEAMELGVTQNGKRRVIPITGGTVSGPKLNGRILNCGADWQRVREDGVAILDAQYLIETEDGVLIEVHNVGNRYGAPEVMARVAAGDAVAKSEYYFRTVPQFEVSAPQYQWMRQNIFLCSGERKLDAVILEIWMVK